MATTAIKRLRNSNGYTPAVNIIRDDNARISYLRTNNAQTVTARIANDYLSGIRAFSIVGAYGTGKSSFLWAFKKVIERQTDVLTLPNAKHPLLAKQQKFVLINGSYASIIETFAKELGVARKDANAEMVLKCLTKDCSTLHKKGKGIVILVDEFGKFLEYAANHTPEKELYFIQQLAEFVNDSNKDALLITTLHQDFNGYSLKLQKHQQHEWDKVKGRLKEITFNEPVEQLLQLAATRLSADNKFEAPKTVGKLLNVIKEAKAFPLKDFLDEPTAKRLSPFDILAAAVLTLALQKYGQNERSLFSFLESHDVKGLHEFDASKEPYYNLASVYDYLVYNYQSFLTTKYNPHYAQWSSIRIALERAEGLLTANHTEAGKLIKAIGLLNIFAPSSIKLNIKFLTQYSEYSFGVKNIKSVIEALESFKILRYTRHSDKYVLFEGTDVDIELAIDEAGNLIEDVSNIAPQLKKHFNFTPILAKSVYFEKGTPRYFDYHLSETPDAPDFTNEIDGFVNLIFSEKLTEKELTAYSAECNSPVLFGWFKETGDIKQHIINIEKIRKARENNLEDKIAVREFDALIEHHKHLLNHFVLGQLFTNSKKVLWYHNGQKHTFDNRKDFNRVLSKICSDYFPDTPTYGNELINRSKLSTPISTAKRSLIRSLINDWNKEDLGYDKTKFPPEKTIYLSLLYKTGIHRSGKDGYVLDAPTDATFQALWNKGLEFINSTRHGQRNLQEFVDILLDKPFKLKQGFVDVWLPIFLCSHRDDFALYSKDSYIPELKVDTLEVLCKSPKDYFIKAFDVAGVKLDLFNRYRSLLNQEQELFPTSASFIETIRPFLSFYKSLPEYSKKTTRLHKATIAFRDAIAQAKDPERTFFDSFPKAFGYSISDLQKNAAELQSYVNLIQTSIRSLRTSFDDLLNRIESYIVTEFVGTAVVFPVYKDALQSRFAALKTHLLLDYQKVFHQRVLSTLDDRKSWLSSLAHGVIGKPLESFSDDDELRFYDKLNELMQELDNLCELSQVDIDYGKEEVIKLEIGSFVEGLKKTLVRLPKTKSSEIEQQEAIFKSKFGKDKKVNVAALISLLQKEINA